MRWTKKKINTLRRLYRRNNARAVAKIMRVSESVIKSAVTNHKIKHSPGYNHMLHSRVALTKAEIKFIRKNYVKLTNHELAERIGRSESVIQRVRRQYGIHKENSGRIKPGNRPWNWNVKGSIKSTPGMRRTQFKKGNLPANTMHDGAITVRLDHPKDRKGRPYQWIRVSVGKWVHYHRWLWEQKNGPVPAKHVVAFKDGNTMNTTLSNLVLLTMAENATRNYNPAKAHQASKELSDNYIAGRLASGDKKLRSAIIHGAPNLIKEKRMQLLNNRILKHERQNQAEQAA